MEAYGSGTCLGDRYRLTSRLATGATAVVWRAVDEVSSRPVAVKALHPHLADDTDLAGRFADEARMAAAVRHPSLVAVHDTIPGPPPAIVLEFVDGPNLRQHLDAGRCSIAEVLGLGWTIADALDVAHRAGLVHRDVKPANIICTSGGHPKLGDFGIATAAAGDRTATGLVLGTAKYLAPEQVRGGQIDPRTDVYALSVVLYEALCGRVPFERVGDLPTAMARLEGPPPIPRSLRPEIPTGVESIVLRGLAREPDARWPSAATLRDAIAAEAESLRLELGPLGLPAGVRTEEATAPDPPGLGPHPPSPEPTKRLSRGATPPSHRRVRWLRRGALLASFAAIATLGVILLSDADPIGDLTDTLSSNEADPVAVRATAYDPEGTGPPGEHDDLAANVLDGDLSTDWHTERYENRSMGTKRGVGIVIELAGEARIDEVTIDTDARDWAGEVYVADSAPASLDQWGPARAAAIGIDQTGSFSTDGHGSAVLVWITDLGEGGPPFRLAVYEVTIS